MGREERRLAEEEARVEAEERRVSDAWCELREKKDTMVTQVPGLEVGGCGLRVAGIGFGGCDAGCRVESLYV